ncbi:hypothetical protein AXG93_3823s1060 [Marchantia polymorpha subsp. ruderalis]|uniref:Ricin B lectin domain-containing protein n=1 Tax=Marchantia polymorpha subsp. ruderalis TaxID=1480154 RepID=A0A176WRQ3_MARPO|nr:hypothetical protein AXG93_3823s1060 [Marchantia polymorpha subsp. ruderalis]
MGGGVDDDSCASELGLVVTHGHVADDDDSCVSERGLVVSDGGHVADDDSCASDRGLVVSHGHVAPAPESTPEYLEKLVTVFCQAGPNYRLSMRADGIVLAFKNLEDPKQQWVQIDMGDKFQDQEGFPAFILVNKATGHAMSHAHTVGDVVTPQLYTANSLNSAILWTQGRDEGDGFTAIRPVHDIRLNLDADHASKKHGGVEDGNKLLIFTWNKQENQLWKVVP